MKYLKLSIGTLVYIFLYGIIYYFYVNNFKVDVILYSSINIALVTLLIYVIIIKSNNKLLKFSNFEIFNAIVIAGLMGYSIAISIPTVLDRSLSFYILEKLRQRGGSIKLNKFEYIFTKEYVRESALVDIRLTEQINSGTIMLENDCVKLTEKGRRLAYFNSEFRKYFSPRKRLLNGEYTDILVDPFLRSDKNPDYLCEE
jgi:hypothetical protein